MVIPAQTWLSLVKSVFLGVKKIDSREKVPIFANFARENKKVSVKNSENRQKSGRKNHFLPVKFMTNHTREKKLCL